MPTLPAVLNGSVNMTLFPLYLKRKYLVQLESSLNFHLLTVDLKVLFHPPGMKLDAKRTHFLHDRLTIDLIS